MDFFKGIGDFFGGLFGKKKKQSEVEQNYIAGGGGGGGGRGAGSPSPTISSKVSRVTNTSTRPSGRSQRDIINTQPKTSNYGRKPDLDNYEQKSTNSLVAGMFNGSNEERLKKINIALNKANDPKRMDYSQNIFGSAPTRFRDNNDRLIQSASKAAKSLGDDELLRRATNLSSYKANLRKNADIHNNEVNNIWTQSRGKAQDTFRMVSDGLSNSVGDTLFGKDDNNHFDWNNPRDYGRFIANLPGGMVGGVVGAANNAVDIVNGDEVIYDPEQGKYVKKDLAGLQKIGKAGDAVISVAGTGFGGSGSLIKSIGTQGAKQVARSGAKNIIKQVAKDALEESMEEGIQNVFSELGENGRLDEGTFRRSVEAATLGGLGGGVMSVGGIGVNKIRTNINTKIDAKINPVENPVSNAVAKVEAGNEIKHKLMEDDQGKYVKGENKDGFNEIGVRNLPKKSKGYLTNNLQDFNVNTTNGDIGMMKETPGKWAYGDELPTRIKRDKLRMTPQLDEMLQATNWLRDDNGNIVSADNQVGKHDGVKSWNYGDVRFEAADPSNTQYSAVANVGIDYDGNKKLYTFDKIKELATPNERVNNSQTLNEARNSQGLFSRASYDSNISQAPDNVKMKLTETADIEAAGQNKSDFDADKYIAEQVKAQKKAQQVKLNEKLGDMAANFKHTMIDDAVAYERYIKQAVKNGRLAKAEANALISELRNDIDKVRSSDMIAQQFIRDNGLAELGKLSTEELNQFQQYLIARRHAADLHKKGIKTGRDLDADLAIIAKYKSKFKNEEKIYRQFNKRLLDYMENNGLISKELYTELKKNKAYTPYQRLMDDISGFTGHSQQLGNLSSEQVIKGIKGSERTILNPIEATMANTMRIINEGQRNIAARKIAENVFSENRLKDGQKPRAGYDTINFMEDGKKVSYEVPKLVASEMKRLNRVLPGGVDKIVRVLSVPAKSLRAGATSLNPMFAASNLVRDQFQTTITGNMGTNLKGTPQALLATFGWGEKANALRAELSRQGIIGSD